MRDEGDHPVLKRVVGVVLIIATGAFAHGLGVQQGRAGEGTVASRHVEPLGVYAKALSAGEVGAADEGVE